MDAPSPRLCNPCDWNFNDPNSKPGFGDLGPEVDVKRMVAEIFGEAPRQTLARWGERVAYGQRKSPQANDARDDD